MNFDCLRWKLMVTIYVIINSKTVLLQEESNPCTGIPNGSYLPHPQGCRYFILCNDGNVNTGLCPNGLAFNPLNPPCDLAATVGCIDDDMTTTTSTTSTTSTTTTTTSTTTTTTESPTITLPRTTTPTTSTESTDTITSEEDGITTENVNTEDEPTTDAPSTTLEPNITCPAVENPDTIVFLPSSLDCAK